MAKFHGFPIGLGSHDQANNGIWIAVRQNEPPDELLRLGYDIGEDIAFHFLNLIF